MSDRSWVEAYVDSFRRVGGMLVGIRRRRERASACLKVLIDAAASLTSSAPAAIGAPSSECAIALAEIAGAALAAGGVAEQGTVNLNVAPDATFVDALARRSLPLPGKLASPLMAASDGDMRTLLWEGAVSELQAGLEAGRSVDAAWLVQPGHRIREAAEFLAGLNASARARPAGVHDARAAALDQELAMARAVPSAHVSAHAFAVHYLTGIYGPGDASLRSTMLRLVATYPPHERATLQASKVAALLSDSDAVRARMALLDHLILLLGPSDGDPSVRISLARDSALVVLLLDRDTFQPGQAMLAVPVAQADAASNSTSAVEQTRGPQPQVASDSAQPAHTRADDAIAEIAREAELAIAGAVAERQARYQAAINAGSPDEAMSVACDAAADDDHEQAWSLLQDIARRQPEADPGDLVCVAPNVLGQVALDSEEHFDEPGAGCFTVLSPAPAEAAAAVARVAHRLLHIDDRGTEHADPEKARTAGLYTPNYLHGVAWCEFGAQVMLDTQGTMSAPMGRTMLAIITQALIEDHVPALVTGWIPALDPQMTPWKDKD